MHLALDICEIRTVNRQYKVVCTRNKWRVLPGGVLSVRRQDTKLLLSR